MSLPDIPTTSRRHPARKYLFFALKAAIGTALVVYMVRAGHFKPAEIFANWSTGWPWLFAAFILIALTPLIGGIRWGLMMHAQSFNVPVSTTIRLTYICAFFNTFLPGSTGGDVVRMYGAAASFRDRRAAAILTVIADRVSGLFALFALTLFVLAVNYDAIVSNSLVRNAAVILGISMLAGVLVITLALSERLRNLRRNFLAQPGRFREVLRHIDEALALFRGRRRVFVFAICLSFLAHLCGILSVFFAARVLGENSIPIERFFFLVPLAFAVNSIPLSPGGVGQGEGFAEALFRTQQSELGAEIFFLYRIIAMAAWLVGLVFYLTGSVRFNEMVAVESAAEKELDTPAPDSASQG